MTLGENIQEIEIEDIISQFDGLIDKQEIENKIIEMGLELENEKKEQFISYIQNANASGGGISKHFKNLDSFLRPDNIDEIYEIFIELQESYKKKIEFLLSNENNNVSKIIKRIQKYTAKIEKLDESGKYKLVNYIIWLEMELKELEIIINDLKNIDKNNSNQLKNILKKYKLKLPKLGSIVLIHQIETSLDLNHDNEKYPKYSTTYSSIEMNIRHLKNIYSSNPELKTDLSLYESQLLPFKKHMYIKEIEDDLWKITQERFKGKKIMLNSIKININKLKTLGVNISDYEEQFLELSKRYEHSEY